jgi:hypothetical protein
MSKVKEEGSDLVAFLLIDRAIVKGKTIVEQQLQ